MSFLLTIISMSFSASIMLVAFIALKGLMKKHLPSSIMYAVLLIILFRMIVPFSPSFSLMNYTAEISGISQNSAGAPSDANDSAIGQDVEVSKNLQQSVFDGTLQTSSDTEKTTNGQAVATLDEKNKPAKNNFDWSKIVFAVWCIGILICMAKNLTAYAILKHKVKNSSEFSETYTDMLSELSCGRRHTNVYISSEAVTPMVIGLFYPMIVVPDCDYSEADIFNILRHEYCHYRRFDVPIKWLTVVARSLHWFNPLITIVFAEQLDKWCELSCDEYAVQNMDSIQKKAYIRTLLKTAELQLDVKNAPLTTMGSALQNMNERFGYISTAKKITKNQVAVSIGIICVTVVFGTLLGSCTVKQTDNVYYADQSNSVSQHTYENALFTITDPEAQWNESRQAWKSSYDSEYYQNKPTLSGVSDNRVTLRSLFNLLNWENYKYIDRVQSKELFSSDALEVNFDDEIYFYLEKDGNLFVWLDDSHMEDLVIGQKYPDYLLADADFEENICVFSVPSDLYVKVESLLKPLFHENYTESSDFDGIVAENGKQYPFSDIDCDFVYAVISGKIRIISDDYGCDFLTDVGSEAYDSVWNAFSGIGLCNQIQPRPECEQTDKHIMIIGPEDYGESYTDEYVTIYADSKIIKARFKGDEIWYSVPKDLSAICQQIAAYQ